MAEFLRLKKSNCKNCYKCIRSCPVKSIGFADGQANILGNECILCGQCFVVCPQNAKEIVSGLTDVKKLLLSGAPVVASVAPSFVANYGAGIRALEQALKRLGFHAAEETARGAAVVKTAYENMLARGDRDLLISSCCHSVNLLIQKHFPEALPYLADVVSPMQAHCIDIKSRIPDAKTVFVGPCLAKKDEADRYRGVVDAVLTFEELTEWLAEENITIEPIPDEADDERGLTRLFPTAGGILSSMSRGATQYTYLTVDGAGNCIAALHDILSGKLHKCFIEMSACAGSCIGGPVMEKYHPSPLIDCQRVADYAGREDFAKTELPGVSLQKEIDDLRPESDAPSEPEIRRILTQMGKTKPEDKLNCGTCGYNSCREKAIAVALGKADISMCLPFLKDKAESFSDNIINNTPNGILVLDEQLNVQQINQAALRMVDLADPKEALGGALSRILDDKDFEQVRETGRGIAGKRVYLARYGRYADETILYDRAYHILIAILRDVTAEETERREKEELGRQTVRIADKVVDNQMRIVQEIASLLGETAAETKIALTKLKESIRDE